jgi:hypothetical protein
LLPEDREASEATLAASQRALLKGAAFKIELGDFAIIKVAAPKGQAIGVEGHGEPLNVFSSSSCIGIGL